MIKSWAFSSWLWWSRRAGDWPEQPLLPARLPRNASCSRPLRRCSRIWPGSSWSWRCSSCLSALAFECSIFPHPSWQCGAAPLRSRRTLLNPPPPGSSAPAGRSISSCSPATSSPSSSARASPPSSLALCCTPNTPFSSPYLCPRFHCPCTRGTSPPPPPWLISCRTNMMRERSRGS